MALAVGLVGTVVVGNQSMPDRDQVLFAGIGGVGAVCAVIGAMCRSRFGALSGGGLGLSVAVIVASGSQGMWLVVLWVLLGAPYLAGFGLAIVLTSAFSWAVRSGAAAAVLVAAMIGVVIGAGAYFIGPTLIGGPCRGTSLEQAAASYSYLHLDSSSDPGLRVSLDAQFREAGQDAELLGAAYRGAATYDDDYITVLRQLCFPATVRPQVDALTAAIDARGRVHRLLADDPSSADLRARLGSSQQAVAAATAELRRVLGLAPLPDASGLPSS